MATLLSLPDEELKPDNPILSAAEPTRLLLSGMTPNVPFQERDFPLPMGAHVKPVVGTRYLSLQKTADEEQAVPSVVHGVSLYGVLQMLHLERKTCILEVISEQRFGTITLVNGEIVDADVDGLEGEAAIYLILTWRHPQTTIMDGVSLFRHTVNVPIAQLLVESVRRQDEAALQSDTTPSPDLPAARSSVLDAGRLSVENQGKQEDWNWLVETLIIGGARAAAVIRARDEEVLALGDEFGGLVRSHAREIPADLATIGGAARRWSRLIDPSVSEIVLRVGDDQLLIAPIDREQQVFAHVRINANDSLEYVRGAIRSVVR